mmetsp:Transcript_4713/g.10186  ORF Transcript_4713/g.10186 Transcript_4713/m.10186 type:complete len:230 (-) Transcript_4713:49-738(-)
MTHRCIIGLGGSLSADFPLFRAHVGRAFVEHVAEAHGFGPWRPTSAALADFAEHGSGIVLCRLWHDSASGASSAPMAAKQCLKYVGVRSSDHFVIAHAESRRSCGKFAVTEGIRKAPAWAKPVLDAVCPQFRPGQKSVEQPLRIEFGVGAPSRTNLMPHMDRFSESRMTAREANAILQSAFPAAFEWLLKRWFGPDAVTAGAVMRRRFPQDIRRKELEREAEQMQRDLE